MTRQGSHIDLPTPDKVSGTALTENADVVACTAGGGGDVDPVGCEPQRVASGALDLPASILL